MKATPDAVVAVTLLPPGAGGRNGQILPRWYGCVMLVQEEGFDVRLRLDSAFSLGTTRKVGLDFLSHELALRSIKTGTRFRLWEGKVIGSGEVLEMAAAT